MNSLFHDKNILILGVSSDIGARLARMFAARGARVVGAYRSESSVTGLRADREIQLIPCDVARTESVSRAASEYAERNLPWDVFISCVGVLEPIGRFFALDF